MGLVGATAKWACQDTACAGRGETRRVARLALMSADREKEDTPTPTERLQPVGKADRAEQTAEEGRKRKEMCKGGRR